MKNVFRMELKGTAEFRAWAKAARKEIKNKIAARLPSKATELMSQANAAAPVKSGKLKGSSFVGKPYKKRSSVGIRAGYTDKKAPAVHQGIHGRTRHITPGLKWFQNTLFAYAGQFKGEMEEEFSNAVASLPAMAPVTSGGGGGRTKKPPRIKDPKRVAAGKKGWERRKARKG